MLAKVEEGMVGGLLYLPLSNKTSPPDLCPAPFISVLLDGKENVVDTVPFQTIDMTPSCQETTEERLGNLATKSSKTMNQYKK